MAATAEDYFPQSTTFEVENVTGAAQYHGLRAILDSEPDALTVGVVHPRWLRRQAVVGDIRNFDFDETTILGSPTFTPDSDAYCIDRSVAASWQEVLDLGRPLRIATYEPGTDPVIEFLADSGGPFRVIYDYGTIDIVEAFDRGELDLIGRCSPEIIRAIFPEWLDQRRIIPLFYVTKPFDTGYLARLGHSGPLPSILELPGLNLDEAQRARLEALQANLHLADATRVFILPAGVPGVLREYWQERFGLIMRDRRFIDTIHDEGYVDWYGYGTSDVILALILRVQALEQDVKAFLYNATGLRDLDRFVQ